MNKVSAEEDQVCRLGDRMWWIVRIQDSSRSHSIFTVYVEGMMENGSIRTGKLNLVDLAGSERQSKTGSFFAIAFVLFSLTSALP